MSIAQSYLAEFRQEAPPTRRILAAVPDDELHWQPHEKSMTLQRLAGHVAEIPGWAGMTLGGPGMDTGADNGYQPFLPESTAELLARFDESVEHFVETLTAHDDDALYAQPWRMSHGEKVLLEMPKAAVVRTFMLSHMVHHRGQLSVYLRLLDVPLPQIYGPTADAPGFEG